MDISSWITHRAAWSPDKVAVRFGGEELTYAALEQAVAGLAGGLGGLVGVRAGDRVAYLGWNSPLVLELLFACARLGGVFVPLNARLAVPELAEVMDDAEPAVIRRARLRGDGGSAGRRRRSSSRRGRLRARGRPGARREPRRV